MATFSEEEFLPISALQHLVFCARQCALIHIEGIWAENLLTVEGSLLHRRAHEERAVRASSDAVSAVAGLWVHSRRLGLVGRADIVEFRPSEHDREQLVPFPVEYKRGRPKLIDADRVQLCAQALCLEEMRQVAVPRGAVFYGETRRREAIAFDADLRRKTEECTVRLRSLLAAGQTPPAEYGRKCRRCSLLDVCMPRATGGGRSAAQYLDACLESR